MTYANVVWTIVDVILIYLVYSGWQLDKRLDKLAKRRNDD